MNFFKSFCVLLFVTVGTASAQQLPKHSDYANKILHTFIRGRYLDARTILRYVCQVQDDGRGQLILVTKTHRILQSVFDGRDADESLEDCHEARTVEIKAAEMNALHDQALEIHWQDQDDTFFTTSSGMLVPNLTQ